MSFTGQLGTADARGANIVPGLAGGVSPPPPPAVTPQAQSPTYLPPVMPILSERFARLSNGTKLTILFPRVTDVGADAAATQTDAYFRPYAHGPRTDGPFDRQRLPHYLNFPVLQANPEPDPAVQIYPPFYPAISLTSPVVRYPFAPRPTNFSGNPAYVTPPPPPDVPPPPPPPESGILGPARNQVPSIPRAPAAEDPRVRPHIDKVATLLNDLLRLGYIQQTGRDEYAIIGGGFALPRAPTVTDDRTVGAVVGATFVNTTNDDVYVCVRNSVGSAVWKLIG